jgi:hypothetical protein
VVNEAAEGNLSLPSYSSGKADEESDQPRISLLPGSAAEPFLLSDSEDSEAADRPIAEPMELDSPSRNATASMEEDELMDDISEHFSNSNIDKAPQKPAQLLRLHSPLTKNAQPVRFPRPISISKPFKIPIPVNTPRPKPPSRRRLALSDGRYMPRCSSLAQVACI